MRTKKEVKKNLEFFLNHTDLSTYEIADKFGIKEYEVVNAMINKEE